MVPHFTGQWSLHRTIRGGELDYAHAHDRFGVKAVEYVTLLRRSRTRPHSPPDCVSGPRTPGRESVDHDRRRRQSGAPDAAERQQAVDNHRRWLDAPIDRMSSIRVNAHSAGSPDEQIEHCATGMTMLLSTPMNSN